jgi:hypothetical protein
MEQIYEGRGEKGDGRGENTEKTEKGEKTEKKGKRDWEFLI